MAPAAAQLVAVALVVWAGLLSSVTAARLGAPRLALNTARQPAEAPAAAPPPSPGEAPSDEEAAAEEEPAEEAAAVAEAAPPPPPTGPCPLPGGAGGDAAKQVKVLTEKYIETVKERISEKVDAITKKSVDEIQVAAAEAGSDKVDPAEITGRLTKDGDKIRADLTASFTEMQKKADEAAKATIAGIKSEIKDAVKSSVQLKSAQAMAEVNSVLDMGKEHADKVAAQADAISHQATEAMNKAIKAATTIQNISKGLPHGEIDKSLASSLKAQEAAHSYVTTGLGIKQVASSFTAINGQVHQEVLGAKEETEKAFATIAKAKAKSATNGADITKLENDSETSMKSATAALSAAADAGPIVR